MSQRLLQVVEKLWLLRALHYDVLRAIERWMGRYEYVPVDRIAETSKIKPPKLDKILDYLKRLKLIEERQGDYVGYTLTTAGLDALALHDLGVAGKITRVGQKLGVGKEADIHICYLDNEPRIIKLYRIKSSFRNIRAVRRYVYRARGWWEIVKKCAAREFTALVRLHRAGVHVPKPLARNRHVILMGYIDGAELVKANLLEPLPIFEAIIEEVAKMVKAGIVHCDLSEYNILVTASGEVYLIDFPQWVHVNDPMAMEYLRRDLLQVARYFHKRYHIPWSDLLSVMKEKMKEAGVEVEISET